MSRLSCLRAGLLALLAIICLSFASAPAAFACHEHGSGTGGGVFDDGTGDDGDWEEKCGGGGVYITVPEMNQKMDAGGRALIYQKCLAFKALHPEITYCPETQTTFICSVVTGPFGTCGATFVVNTTEGTGLCSYAVGWFKLTTVPGDIEIVANTPVYCVPFPYSPPSGDPPGGPDTT